MYFLVNMTNALEQSNNIVQVVPQRGTRETNRVLSFKYPREMAYI